MQKNNNIGNRCVIYARYSCSNQTEQSIEGQMHDCEQFAARNNLQIVNSYIDRATTATTDKRPQFLKMIADSKPVSYTHLSNCEVFAFDKPYFFIISVIFLVK